MNVLNFLPHLIILFLWEWFFQCIKSRVKIDGSSLKQENVSFTHKAIVNLYIVYKINLGPYNRGVLRNSLFGAVKLTTYSDPDNFSCSGHGIGFDASGSCSLPDGSGFGKNGIIFGVDNSSSVHIDNKKRYVNSCWRSSRWVRWF